MCRAFQEYIDILIDTSTTVRYISQELYFPQSFQLALRLGSAHQHGHGAPNQNSRVI